MRQEDCLTCDMARNILTVENEKCTL